MKKLLTLLAALLITASVGIAIFATGDALAASSANLSISQQFSGSATRGATLDTVRIHNAGPASAGHINLTMLIRTTSPGLGILSSGSGVCELAPAPPGYTIAIATCQLASLPAGGTELDKITWSGTVGLAFTSTATVGTTNPDPNLANNISSASSWFGPRADLRLTQSITSGPAAGKATAVTTITDLGPNKANALQLIMEINSPGFTGVIASSNISASCQFIPPSVGNNRAVACTTNSLATGAKWIVTFKFAGQAGAALAVASKVTANNPLDPVTTNNSASSLTTYHA